MPAIIAKIRLKRQRPVASRAFEFNVLTAPKTILGTFSVIKLTRLAVHGFNPSSDNHAEQTGSVGEDRPIEPHIIDHKVVLVDRIFGKECFEK